MCTIAHVGASPAGGSEGEAEGAETREPRLGRGGSLSHCPSANTRSYGTFCRHKGRQVVRIYFLESERERSILDLTSHARRAGGGGVERDERVAGHSQSV